MLNIELPESLREDFKIWCIRNKTTMRDNLIEHIKTEIKKEE